MRTTQGKLSRASALVLVAATLATTLAACGESNHPNAGRQRSGDGVSGAPSPGAPTGKSSGKAQSGKGDGTLKVGAAEFAPRPAAMRDPGNMTIRIPLSTADRAVTRTLLSLQASQVVPPEYTGTDAATLSIATAKLDGPGALAQQAETMDFRIDCVRGGAGTRYNNRNGFDLTLPKNTTTTLVVGVQLARTFPDQTPTLELQSPSLTAGGTEIPLEGLAIKPVAGVSLTVEQGTSSASYATNTKDSKPLLEGEVVHTGSGQLIATGNVLGAKAGEAVELVARRVRQQDPAAAFIPLGEPEGLATAVSTGAPEGGANTDSNGDYRIVLPKPVGRRGYLVKYYARVAGNDATTAGASCPASVVNE